MKKLIAALVLATSFAALANDDAAKKDPAKTEKKSTEKKTTETKTTDHADRADTAVPVRVPAGARGVCRAGEEVSLFAAQLHTGGVGLAQAGLTPLARSVL